MTTDPRTKAAVNAHAALLVRIVELARKAGELAARSPESALLDVDGHGIHGTPGGMCELFVREVMEAATGHPWPYRTAWAQMTETLLIRDHRRIGGHLPGCLGFFDDDPFGHVFVWLSDEDGGLVAENTSSGHRGNPTRAGTKLSRYADLKAAHGGAEARFYYAGPL